MVAANLVTEILATVGGIVIINVLANAIVASLLDFTLNLPSCAVGRLVGRIRLQSLYRYLLLKNRSINGAQSVINRQFLGAHRR